MDVFQEAQMLRNVPLFSGLSDSELKLLAFTGRVLRFEPGETLVHQGERADCAYVILEGEVEIVVEATSGPFLVAVQGKNALVGEMGIICDAPRSATVRAKTPARALCISGEIFLRLACENPQRALYVMRQLSNRLAAENIAHAALREELRQIKAAAKGGH